MLVAGFMYLPDENTVIILHLTDKLMAQISTAISDLVLALCSFYVAYETNGRPYQSFYGLILIGLAASLGVCRFGLKHPSKQYCLFYNSFSLNLAIYLAHLSSVV